MLVRAQKPPPESFLDRSVRIANQGVAIMGTLKGLYDTGKMVASGLGTAATYASPMLALM